MALVALLSISIVLFSFSIKTTTQTHAHCIPDQHHALIQLKKYFNTTELHSWNASTDCCIWDGVTCDEQTGMVTALDLSQRNISGELNPALFNLTSLQYLNLAWNIFNNIIIPQNGFERLANLTHLDLSHSGCTGQVPISISALRNLIYLDLSANEFYLHDTGLKTLLRNLTNLQDLYLNGVDISLNGSEWGKAVIQVGPTLQVLSMAYCGLRGNFPDDIFHLTNLTKLISSHNYLLSSQLPVSIGNLQYLDLSNCSFYGDVPPSITNNTRLEYLDLGFNRLTGMIPMSLFSHPSLKRLDLSYNQLSGFLPEFSNRSSILAYIYLESNNLQGQLPISLFKSAQLIEILVSSNNFSGTLNLDVIKHNKELEYLDLSNNKLSSTEGKNHQESFYASFPQMSDILLASCNLTKFPTFLRYQKNIRQLDLSNNKIDGVIPNWLCSNTSIVKLNLSHNFFAKIDCDTLENFISLDIHSNRISGSVPFLLPEIWYADCSSNYFISLPAYFTYPPLYLLVSNNSLTGEIPLSICNAPSKTDPLLLQVLDLSYNNLTGTMPSCLLEDAEFRGVLKLKSNQLSGPLPQNVNQGCRLETIDLSGNRINGSLPQSLMNCNTLEVLDLGNNQILDGFPFWLGNLQNLRVLVLRSNQFYGTISNTEDKKKKNDLFFPALQVFDLSSNRFRGIIPKVCFENMKVIVTNFDYVALEFSGSEYYQNSITVILKGQEREIKNSLSIFSSLDLSQNGFSGDIPEEIGQLQSLHVLNLSHNALTGPIPSEFANLEQLESLDLSSNQLSGHIPHELISLTFIESFNLSYNYLVGEIPEDRQFSTFSNDSYLGNPGLCGSPLSMKCAAAPSAHWFNKGQPSKFSTDIIELSVSIGLGLGVGFAFVIWATISWENGRKWFNFIIDRFYFRYFH